jgi:hypothetical protein
MAEEEAKAGTGDTKAQGFSKNLVEDVSNYLTDDSSWTQARNAINNSKTGDIGSLGNEPANIFCTQAPYTIIGTIHLKSDAHMIFSTDDSNSEIGLFFEESCTYYTLVNDPCLSFLRAQLISGVSKENFQCRWGVYWSDGVNPDRTITIDVDNVDVNLYTNPESPIPWIQNCTIDSNGCQFCTNTPQLDCDKLRLEPIVQQPCVRVQRSASVGVIPNGSYYAVIAYTLQEQRITDYCLPSNVQPLFIHKNTASSLDIIIEEIDSVNYDEFELVLVQFFNGQTVATKVGNYSTRQKRITLDYIDKAWPQILLANIPLRTSIADKSDAIYEAGPYMLRVGPTDKFDFNYQPLANRIRTKWVNVEYPEDYYRQGGSNAGYLRDEVYSFFIRWVYNTGDKSASFHIPGRPATVTDVAPLTANDALNAQPELQAGIPLVDIKNWMVNNTATVTAIPGTQLSDGGVVVAEGNMGYWESTELYDDDTPNVWNASAHPWSSLISPPYAGTQINDYDLCGVPVRHHKFPDNATDTGTQKVTNHFKPGGNAIRIMGVRFDNVVPPVDNAGNPITNIVGYEILRGSRVGNETVIAKGMINNMFKFNINSTPDTGDNDASVNLVTNRQGLYPNYPYNDLNPDRFISTTATSWSGTGYNDLNPNADYSKQHFTFHSPDTQFVDPYLAASEIKIYGNLYGNTEGAFAYPDKHPRDKFVTDTAFIVSILAGAGIATLAMVKKRTVTQTTPYSINLGGVIAGPGIVGAQPTDFGVSAGTYITTNEVTNSALQTVLQNTALVTAASGFDAAGLDFYALSTANLGAAIVPGVAGGHYEYASEETPYSSLPPILRTANNTVMFYNYLTEGVDATLRLIKAYSRYNQFALQYNSHCKYTGFEAPQATPIVGPPVEINKRTVIDYARYLEPYLQDFGADYRINNLYRSRSVALETYNLLRNPTQDDNSRATVGQANISYNKPTTPFKRTASSHYVGLKQPLRNQYGKVESIIQVPVSTCAVNKSISGTDILFNGDTYVGRYTEKNTMFYFSNWMYDEPDGSEFNYRINRMIPYSSFWMDTEDFDWSDFINSVTAAFSNIGNFFSTIVTPSDLHCFDRPGTVGTGFFTLKNCYMYLFNSGVRDFFVESSINVDLRDWGEPTFERHYDPYEYTDLSSLFSTDIIKSGNFFKYDFSLSINKLFNNLIPWGNVHRRDYNPFIAETCYVYRPKRVIYSLPQTLENKKDNWRVFLPLNYKDFNSRVTSIKNINLNGAVMLFEDLSPIQFLGSEQLTLESGTKITIGDGGLFNQPLQYLDNSDRQYEYGSCQNRLSIAATPVGIFYMSQNQGKIFAVSGQGLQEITLPGQLKWWFLQYLPYVLTDDFPDFELTDNPVIGIGCQTIYDNQNMLVYFCKKDYRIRKDNGYTLDYRGNNVFTVVETGATIELGDPNFFFDASWTVSYDPKLGQFISYHDWHPNLLLGSKDTFLSIKDNAIWKHNTACDHYCNYYGVDYPFEIEFQSSTVQNVTTLRSIEYQLECYVYADNCYDRFHVLDFNFDEAIIYNSEQCSGLLKLNLSPKNNPTQIVQYPIINPNNIQILFDKVENKYRFNQFWDITKDRGEYTSAQETIFLTQPNGYVKNLNAANLDYNKYPTQRKKFRHYRQVVLLRRLVSGNIKMLFNIANVKNLNSPR